jgi:hypothetical protein
VRRRSRPALLLFLGASAAGAAALAGIGLAATGPVLPDLTIELPTGQSVGAPSVFLDPVEQPGRLLYRFDSVIRNSGQGAFEVLRNGSGPVQQVIYGNGGRPAGKPSATSNTTDPNEASRVTLPNATITYSSAPGHNHFHFGYAAGYTLIGNGQSLGSEKTGFCVYDSYGGSASSSYPQGTAPWCRPGDPSATFIRMGLTPGVGDYYWAALANQWVPIPAGTVGSFTLRGTADPNGLVQESNEGNNSLSVTRTIPGATAASVTPATITGPTAIALSGTVVGADVPVRKPGTGFQFYATPAPQTLTFQVTRAPAHGTLSTVTSTGGLTARVTYTPDAGYSGPDSFRYTTTDARNLGSAEATVSLTVGTTAPPTNQPPKAVIGVDPASPQTGQAVVFTDRSTDQDGTIASRSWDLNGDGVYGDEVTPTATRTFTAAGTYTIGLRVTDDKGAQDTTTVAVPVSTPSGGNPVPAGNFTTNPSFESGTSGWVGWQATVTRVALADAPNGAAVAKVARTSGAYFTIDDSPDSVRPSVVGATYKATAWVKAADPSSVGKQAYVSLRETTPAGAFSQSTNGFVTLTSTFQPVTVTLKAKTAGRVDVYAGQSGGTAGNAFYVDLISVVRI